MTPVRCSRTGTSEVELLPSLPLSGDGQLIVNSLVHCVVEQAQRGVVGRLIARFQTVLGELNSRMDLLAYRPQEKCVPRQRLFSNEHASLGLSSGES